MELSITQQDAGHTADGLPLYIFALGNRHGMEVRISTLGGAIAGLRAPDRHGRLADVVHGKAPDSGIHLLPAPGRALHRLAWHAVPLVEDASVGLRLVSPGPLAVVATYYLDDANTLSLHCQSAAAGATICLRTAFNMAGEGAVPGQLLTLHAARVAPVGGREQEVAGTAWDCRSARPVGELPGPARYLLQAGPGGAAETALQLLDPGSGRRLQLATDAASLRLSAQEPLHVWLEPVMAAAGGTLRLHLSAQA
jgi:galactose mutarotase-like enzyme